MKKLLVILIVLVLFGGGVAWSNLGEAQAAAAIDIKETTNAAMEAQILRSTIHIEMFDVYRVEGGQREVRITEGLGTVVQYGGHHFILTHNHWSIPAAELNMVQIRNGAGNLLLVLYQGSFYGLVRYQDEGTMLLDMPEGLTGVDAAELGDGTALEPGSTVWLATNDFEGEMGIPIETALVERVDAATVPARLWMQGQESAVNRGDSGGGVWADGKLVANIWTILATEETLDTGIIIIRPTGAIKAGLQPLLGTAGVVTADLTADTAADGGFERGATQ